MPEMKSNFQRGKMNKDLDERLVPNGEYRDALNVEIATSDGSDVGTLQTLPGNLFLGGQWDGVCVGSVADDKIDKLYFMVAGDSRDYIIQYNSVTQSFTPVCVDHHSMTGVRALNFNKEFLITGINVVDDLLFWTDNNSEPKRINITRGKAFSDTISPSSWWTTHTDLMVRDTSVGAAPNALVNSGKRIEEEHLTVIRRGPPAAPVLEMLDTALLGDWDGDLDLGGEETSREVSSVTGPWLDSSTGGPDWMTNIVINVVPDTDGDPGGADFSVGDYLNIHQSDDRTIKVRLKVISGGPIGFTCEILSGNKEIVNAESMTVEIEQRNAMFQFKFPRFACRYKYEDGEYSTFSPFTEVAFLPGKFNYVPKEGYNLGMMNNVRKLVIKDFVHDRQISDNVISIDILYKESNSSNIYSVKTIKKREADLSKWDEWNAISRNEVIDSTLNWNGTKGRVKGYMPITTEMIHAVLPANQLLRPWDAVPRKALAQEVIGNRVVYGNYLQNYNLSNDISSNIKVDIRAGLTSKSVGSVVPEEIHAGEMRHLNYYPAKSIKTLRTYQVGIVYLDEYGRETPVFSEDKRGASVYSSTGTSEASVYADKDRAPKRTALKVTMENNPPSWATHMKFFVKETSNEYYNLAMDRWYDAEDGNIWLSFASADRNKVDEETFLILKKEHDSNVFVDDPAKYKIIAIENEAPRFIKLQDISMGGIKDGYFNADAGSGTAHWQIAPNATGFPGEEGGNLHSFQINVHKDSFDLAGWKESLINQDISQCFFRMVAPGAGTSFWYRVKQISFDAGDGTYVIKSGKLFGGDMAFTSADGTYFNRLKNCELQVMKKIPEDRAEFEGRFFVKILKDHTLIERLGISSTVESDLVVIGSMKVQYIAPQEQQVDWGGWEGYGTSPMKISMDPDMTYFHPSNYTGGHGEKFWKMAGDDEETTTSVSSGWFIDKVEAFRPMRQVRNFVSTKDDNYRWNSSKAPRNALLGSGRYHTYWNKPAEDLLQATGIDTYNQADFAYLGLDMRSPGTDSDVLRSNSGHNVSRSLGIDPSIGLIHLSYAGLGDGHGGGSYSGSGTYDNADWAFQQGDKHGTDMSFINKIRQPGTIWGWAEDPGQVKYKTIIGLPTNTNSDYTSVFMSREKFDRDGEAGVFLYNYASFNDYFINEHHKHYYSVDWNSWSSTFWKEDFASRSIEDDIFSNYPGLTQGTYISLKHHNDDAAIDKYPGGLFGITNAPAGWDWSPHYKFPTGIQAWKTCYNRRRRFAIFAEAVDIDSSTGLPYKLGAKGPHYYLPTNNPNFAPHFNSAAEPITVYPPGHPQEGDPFDDIAPGIRPDGMYWGYNGHPSGPYQFDSGDGTGVQDIDQIPQFKRWDANYTTNNAAPRESGVPGSVTFQIWEHFEGDSEKFTSTNPAIWETEPKEDVGLDLYHEVGQIYPIDLNNKTIEQFVGPAHLDVTKNSYVQCWDPPYAPGSGLGTIPLGINDMAGVLQADVRVLAASGNYVRIGIADGVLSAGGAFIGEDSIIRGSTGHSDPPNGSYLMFHRADGSRTEAFVGPNTYTNAAGTWYELVDETGGSMVHNRQIVLPWFNCYSFGNGVESDRIRDDYNQVKIDNGAKVSTTLEEPYSEERMGNGFIWSGLYNSTSGVNDLNQFIAAEKITKNSNPSYGSIQKLHARDSDLVAFCEDRVLKVLANKDALYNADGNTNMVSTNRVLGNIKPFAGKYGISKNPESFASDSYRSYFSDSSRGAILRLSQDGLTAISDVGMHDFFADTLAGTGDHSIFGSFDDNRGEYNITLTSMLYSYVPPADPCEDPLPTDKYEGQVNYTLSFSEKSKGWVSFKSWSQENGISLNNSYYTFKNGDMYRHHVNPTHNNFYGTQQESSVDVLLNKGPGVIKSFSTFNYEGSQARITPGINNNPDYYDNLPKSGWYMGEASSNAQELGVLEFWDKEDKWFTQVKGLKTEWLNDGTAGNIDPREFSFQGIGNASSVVCPECPEVVSWNCNEETGDCYSIPGGSGVYPNQQDCIDCCGGVSESWSCIAGAGCIDPGDGSGTWSSFCECVVKGMCCENGEDYFFTCQGLTAIAPIVTGCMDDGVTTDPFITQQRPTNWVGAATTYSAYANVHSCDCVYTTLKSWDCHEGNCNEIFDGSGEFPNEDACTNECGDTGDEPHATWNCSGKYGVSLLDGTLIGPSTCYDPGTGFGQYSTLAGCVAICSGSGDAPCDDYPGDLLVATHPMEVYCCENCATAQPGDPCYDFCVEWGDCCDTTRVISFNNINK